MAKGRHRAARELPVSPKTALTVGTVALTGLALAGTVGAQSASATPGGVWNRVAACESSNHWHIDTGNGYYGGLQFSQSTWAGYHGRKYAARANLASRGEQIEVARRVLAFQGRDAWPVCGPRAGLTRASGEATHGALPDVAGVKHEKAHGAKNHARTPAGTHARAHRVRAHRVRAHRGKAHHNTRHVRAYTVRSGDTLSAIAQRLHVEGGWHALWQHNRARVHNPNLIKVGQTLRIPR